jgi:phosphatidylserine/phosphatidylglycerophosphate/cardiolipin synthase-like enzyme
LEELLNRAVAFAAPGTRLDVAVPFFDDDSRLWQLLVSAAQERATVRLLTREPPESVKQESLSGLLNLGAKVVLVPYLHAKALVWVGRNHEDILGYVGSHNLTQSSEVLALEMGIVVRGRGTVEMVLARDVYSAFERWERSARRNRRGPQTRSGMKTAARSRLIK